MDTVRLFCLVPPVEFITRIRAAMPLAGTDSPPTSAVPHPVVSPVTPSDNVESSFALTSLVASFRPDNDLAVEAPPTSFLIADPTAGAPVYLVSSSILDRVSVASATPCSQLDVTTATSSVSLMVATPVTLSVSLPAATTATQPVGQTVTTSWTLSVISTATVTVAPPMSSVAKTTEDPSTSLTMAYPITAVSPLGVTTPAVPFALSYSSVDGSAASDSASLDIQSTLVEMDHRVRVSEYQLATTPARAAN